MKMRVNIGGVSILMIFVILCLTTFATLSLVSANADRRLSQRAAQAVEEYYTADAAAEEQLALVDNCLKNAGQGSLDAQGYFAACADYLQNAGDFSVSWNAAEMQVQYQVPLNEEQSLSVELVCPEPSSQGERYRVTAWQVVMTDPWVEESNALDLWDGGLAGGFELWSGELD